jgi:DNA-directed RNA polymerase subunit RPC12/RpoP
MRSRAIHTSLDMMRSWKLRMEDSSFCLAPDFGAKRFIKSRDLIYNALGEHSMKDKTVLQTADKRDKHQTDEEASFTCNECGTKFEKPLFTNISSEGLVQTYYACPHCLSKLPEEEEKETRGNEAAAPPEEPEKTQPKPQNEKCQHFLGYLKKRPKETAIPEACWTCQRIIECMANK